MNVKMSPTRVCVSVTLIVAGVFGFAVALTYDGALGIVGAGLCGWAFPFAGLVAVDGVE
jgi:hypothetical protein